MSVCSRCQPCQSAPSTCARRLAWASFLWMPIAMSHGEVTCLTASTILPSGITTLMGSGAALAASTCASGTSTCVRASVRASVRVSVSVGVGVSVSVGRGSVSVSVSVRMSVSECLVSMA